MASRSSSLERYSKINEYPMDRGVSILVGTLEKKPKYYDQPKPKKEYHIYLTLSRSWKVGKKLFWSKKRLRVFAGNSIKNAQYRDRSLSILLDLFDKPSYNHQHWL